MRLATALAMSALFAACGDIEVRSIRVPDSVPATLAGEWTGNWQSDRDSSNGSVVLRMQDFQGEAVVSFQLDNACVEAREYRFRTTGTTIELLDGDVVVFAGQIGTDRTLTGSYACPEDNGSWDATWTRNLPPLVDLGGRWEGTVSAFGFPPQAMRLDLDLVVRGGGLVLEGAMQLPGLVPVALPVRGLVQFQDLTFDVSMVVLTGTALTVQMFGVGDLATREIGTGLLQTNGDPLLPFSQAAWRASFVP